MLVSSLQLKLDEVYTIPEINYGDNSHRYTGQNQLRQGVSPRQSPSQRQSRERGVAGCRDERDDQSPHHQPSAEATGADRQAAWEDQDSRQGKGSPQHAQNSHHTRQDELREGVSERPSPRHHQNRERGLAGCRIRGHNQPHLGQQDKSEADRQTAWVLQNSRQGEVSPQNAQKSTRNSRQDHVRQGVSERPSPRQRQSDQRGLAGCRIRRDDQSYLGQQDEGIFGSDGKHSWEDQGSRRGKGNPHWQETGKTS